MAKSMRLNALKMALNAGNIGAHLGGGFSCIEIFAVMYGGIMNFNISDPMWDERDRFLVSKAHCVLAYYTALYEVGFISLEELETFESNGSFLAGHPMRNLKYGIEYSGGSLGLALSVGVGMAWDAKQKKRKNRVFVLLGDGECDEGSNWEAFMSASQFCLDNLIVIIDKNNLQYDGLTSEIMNLGNLSQKLMSFGWEVFEVNGHNVQAIYEILTLPIQGSKPRVIIADTIKGKGVSFMEGNREWHHKTLNQVQFETAISEIEREIIE
ncbi:MAG: transketolase [Planctomycetaceae bacterium]|nr:transketolase [Planctomycetaceae bacterium]